MPMSENKCTHKFNTEKRYDKFLSYKMNQKEYDRLIALYDILETFQIEAILQPDTAPPINVNDLLTEVSERLTFLINDNHKILKQID